MIRPQDVTIIIPHLGKTKEQKYALEQCLRSLQETVPDIKKIITINGHRFEDELTLLAEATEPFEIKNISIMVMEDQGQCKAVNAAVATTNTPWIFVTNDDMIYAPGWFERLTEFNQGTRLVNLDDDKQCCISPQLIEPRSGAPTFDVFFAGGAGGDFDKEKWLLYVKEQYQFRTGFSPLRTGFNLPFLIKRELWDTIGGYDINYDPWGSNSDSDLEYKIKLAGVQPYQNTNCIVYHFSQTSGTFEPRNDSYRFKNYAYFKEKFGFDRTDDGIWEASFTIPTKEEGRIYTPEWEGKYA